MNRLIQKILENIPKDYFTSQELANLFPGSSDVRYGLIKRALASGHLNQVKRGLYYLATSYQKKPINPYTLGQLIYGPSYISLESALSWHGWIPEAVYAFTSVSLKKSKEFNTPLGWYSYTRVPQKVLYCGVERKTDQDGNVFFMAQPLKALLDYLYLRKKKWLRLKDMIGDLRIDQQELKKISQQTLNLLQENYSCLRIRQFLKILKKELKR